MSTSEGFEVERADTPHLPERPRVVSGRRGKPFADLLAKREERSPDLAGRLGFSSAAMRAGALVRAWREARGLTQRELAERLGVSQERISNIERGVGKHGPTFDVMTQIADACGYPLVQTWSAAQEREVSSASRGRATDVARRPYGSPPATPLHDIIAGAIITALPIIGAALIGYVVNRVAGHLHESELTKAERELRERRGRYAPHQRAPRESFDESAGYEAAPETRDAARRMREVMETAPRSRVTGEQTEGRGHGTSSTGLGSRAEQRAGTSSG